MFTKQIHTQICTHISRKTVLDKCNEVQEEENGGQWEIDSHIFTLDKYMAVQKNYV